MPSLRSRLLLFLLKNSNLFRLQFRKKKIDWTEHAAILRFREECEKSAARFGKIPSDIEISPVDVDGLKSEWIVRPGTTRDEIVLFFHGGGYVAGSLSDHRAMVAGFVKRTEINALHFEYRLAPEHPFPAALDDSVKVYQWLLGQGFSPSRTIFVGASAGGGLCLATLLALKDQAFPLPRATVALSPWTDLKCSGESYRTNLRKCLAPEGSCYAFSKHYTGDQDPGLPLISPLYGDLRGLPPMLILAGDAETLYDDSVSFAEKAKAAGIEISLKIGKGMFHCYPLCAPLFPEATEAVEEIRHFIHKHITNLDSTD